jgi:uncharacterized protein (TIGR00369 family)
MNFHDNRHLATVITGQTAAPLRLNGCKRPLSEFLLACRAKAASLWAMKVLPHTHSCFVCGESNPVGLKLLFHTDGNAVHAHFTPRPEHIGFKGVVHGGLISTVLDEIMVWACAVQTKRFAFCAELNVRFLKSATPDAELTATAELGRIGETASSRRRRN